METIIEGAVKHGLTEIIILGYDKAGHEYFAYSSADSRRQLWLLEVARHEILDFHEDTV